MRIGVKLSGVPFVAATHEAIQGQRVAIDVPNLVYAFYASSYLQSGNVEGARIHGQRGVIQRVLDLAELGARCVLVFDGSAHPLKREVLEQRNAARQKSGAPRLLPEHYEPIRQAATALGVPIVEAKHDAEAQACVMARRGQVDVVATTDWDALAMGAPRLLRRLSGKSFLRGGAWDLVRLDEALRALEVQDAEALALACVLMGCDYYDGLAGVGEKKALKLARGHTSTEPFAHLLVERGLTLAEQERVWLAWRLLVEPPATPVRDVVWRAPSSGVVGELGKLVGMVDAPQLRAGIARLSLVHEPSEARRDADEARAMRAAARENEAAIAQEQLKRTNPAQSMLGAFL